MKIFKNIKFPYQLSSAEKRVLKRNFINSVKQSNKCFFCGEDNPSCLTFHHIDPATKKECISDLLSSSTLTKVKEEIRKCVVVCINCHTKLHNLQPIKIDE